MIFLLLSDVELNHISPEKYVKVNSSKNIISFLLSWYFIRHSSDVM